MNKKIPIINIAGRAVGAAYAPFVVAEMSGNHNQSLDRALEIVDAAASAGAHGLKLQTYTADTMTLETRKEGFVVEDPNSLWHGYSLYELYKEAHTPWEWHEPIFERAKSHGLIPFSSPFDSSAVDFLEELNVPCYKIASFENTDLRLIKRVAETGKPIIISTGMASIADISVALEVVRNTSTSDVILLKCTSTYPATPDNSNILTIPHMMEMSGCNVGISDHTMGVGTSIAAVAHGACFVEKHFTMNRSDGGVDSTFSLEPNELRTLVVETERAWRSLGLVCYGPSQTEKSSKVFKRSLYVVVDMKAGEQIKAGSIRAIRPGYGLETKYHDIFIGLTLTKDAKVGTPLTWDLVK